MRKRAGKRHRFQAGRLHWAPLPGGGYYPFGLRAAKAAVLLLIGKWAELEELYEKDYSKAGEAGLRDAQARLLMEQGELLGWRNRHDRAEDFINRAIGIFREIGDDRGLTQCENGLAVICMASGEYDSAEKLITEATERAKGKGHKDALCWLLNSHAVLCRERKQCDRALSFLEERMAISQELGLVEVVASSHMNMAVLLSEKGLYEQALEHNQAAMTLSQRMGDVVQQHYALYNQAHILRKLGRKAECLEYLDKALAVTRHLGDDETEKQILKDINNVEGSDDIQNL